MRGYLFVPDGNSLSSPDAQSGNRVHRKSSSNDDEVIFSIVALHTSTRSSSPPLDDLHTPALFLLLEIPFDVTFWAWNTSFLLILVAKTRYVSKTYKNKQYWQLCTTVPQWALSILPVHVHTPRLRFDRFYNFESVHDSCWDSQSEL